MAPPRSPVRHRGRPAGPSLRHIWGCIKTNLAKVWGDEDPFTSYLGFARVPRFWIWDISSPGFLRHRQLMSAVQHVLVSYVSYSETSPQLVNWGPCGPRPVSNPQTQGSLKEKLRAGLKVVPEWSYERQWEAHFSAQAQCFMTLVHLWVSVV